jgi:hypothetical protein
MGYNLVARLAQHAGRPELADRLEFGSRLHYRAGGHSCWLSTVALTMYRKDVLA